MQAVFLFLIPFVLYGCFACLLRAQPREEVDLTVVPLSGPGVEASCGCQSMAPRFHTPSRRGVR